MVLFCEFLTVRDLLKTYIPTYAPFLTVNSKLLQFVSITHRNVDLIVHSFAANYFYGPFMESKNGIRQDYGLKSRELSRTFTLGCIVMKHSGWGLDNLEIHRSK